MSDKKQNQPRKEQDSQPQRFGAGPDGVCLCPECGEEKPHRRGVPCYEEKCPVCGARMIRKI